MWSKEPTEITTLIGWIFQDGLIHGQYTKTNCISVSEGQKTKKFIISYKNIFKI